MGPKIYDQDTNTWHREPENTRNTWRLSFGSGTKLLFTFLSSRFFDLGRESDTISFYADFSIWTPPRVAHFADPKNRLPSSRLKSQLTDFFFSNPQILSPRFRAWRHSRPRSHFLTGVIIVISLIVTSAPRLHVNICTQLTHVLTNPCTKRKVLSLSKPKDKIYKTKNDNIKKISAIILQLLVTVTGFYVSVTSWVSTYIDERGKNVYNVQKTEIKRKQNEYCGSKVATRYFKDTLSNQETINYSFQAVLIRCSGI